MALYINSVDDNIILSYKGVFFAVHNMNKPRNATNNPNLSVETVIAAMKKPVDIREDGNVAFLKTIVGSTEIIFDMYADIGRFVPFVIYRQNMLEAELAKLRRELESQRRTVAVTRADTHDDNDEPLMY